MTNRRYSKEIIVSCLYILGLLAYLFINTSLVLPFQIIISATASFLSYLIIKKVSNSSNYFFAKLYFCLALNTFLFSLIIFFCFAGRALAGDSDAILSQLIIPFSTAFLGLIMFFVEIPNLSKKRVETKKYNLTKFSIILTVLLVVFLGLFYYNPIILKVADNPNNPNPEICMNMITITNSVLFDPSSKKQCSLWSTEEMLDEKQCENLCNIYSTDCNQLKSACYDNVAFLKNDVGICLKGLEFNMVGIDSCITHTAKNISACDYLSGGTNYSSKIGAEDSMYNKDFCLLMLAPKAGDKNICNSIQDPKFKKDCLADYDSERQKILEVQ